MGVRPDPLSHARYWDGVVNVLFGCEFAHRFIGGRKLIDPSCLNCYAVTYAAGLHAANDLEWYRGTTEHKRGRDSWTTPPRLTVLPDGHGDWTEFFGWKFPKPLLGKGKPPIIWVDSMSDLFHPGHPPEAVARILENLVISPHIGLVVSKYCEQMVEYFSTKPAWWKKWFILVFSAGGQRWWDWRWNIMRPLAEAGWIVGTSIQPMLKLVILPDDFRRLGRWVICGGEQYPGHRKMDPDWARSLRDQCKGANPPVRFYCKQMTRGWRPPDLLFQELPTWP
jgi:protein gp37